MTATMNNLSKMSDTEFAAYLTAKAGPNSYGLKCMMENDRKAKIKLAARKEIVPAGGAMILASA